MSLAQGALSSAKAVGLAAHLESCESCRALVGESTLPDLDSDPGEEEATTRRLSVPPPKQEPGISALAFPKGTRLGPYVLGEMLGLGGMGVVYVAEDTRLGRKVALKLLRPARKGVEEERRGRLLREAQAMARVSHPNVLPVFELGSAEGRDYLAMEWVEGTTLAGWLREKEHSWEEVLEKFLAAGAGLAAAHREGLVHRDFKPANVLVGKDGRVRVTDFGLVRRWRAEANPLDETELILTRVGTTLGTPAYMSPEQRRGRRVDARSDQYSFCVALYEALHGERPAQQKVDDAQPSQTPHPRPARGRLPEQVVSALSRGLSHQPAARFTSMEPLLQALSRSHTSREWRWLGVAALLLVLLGGGLGLVFWSRAHGARQGPEDSGASELVDLIELHRGKPHDLLVSGTPRVSVDDPRLMTAEVVPGRLQLEGLEPGVTRMTLSFPDGTERVYTVSIE
ncbi:serine/threonine-protein kinase [Myxococcus landrumensis]|uniref:Serine/threonine protein kinase n=1 Tax=Myxococcus landrumensis TaxID=2813577 RepID=A0ABX7N049_9BACT|nr:serine/threonine-protein kinase [Myxococcus landrumus]QSQ11886.1 serine/threonine protein kinase [Myxococcus landrumus]